jgi:hypothetical protein
MLEKILDAARTRQEQARIEESISAYYSSLSDEEVIEQSQWAEFALREFPSEP